MAAEEIGIEAEKLTESKLVEEQLKELSESYAQYMNVDLSNEKARLTESTDELLTKLEEFLAVIELVRNDNVQCLGHVLPKVTAKYEQLQRVFASIDKLEVLVNIVKERLDSMSAMVSDAEKRMLPESSISKFLTPLFARKDSTTKSQDMQSQFQPPVIFRVEDYISTTNSDSPLHELVNKGEET